LKTFYQWLEARDELTHSGSAEKIRGKAPYSLAARTNLRNQLLGDPQAPIGSMEKKKDPPWRKPAEIEKQVISPKQKWGLPVVN
jgi:hypothetical protein